MGHKPSQDRMATTLPLWHLESRRRIHLPSTGGCLVLAISNHGLNRQRGFCLTQEPRDIILGPVDSRALLQTLYAIFELDTLAG